jgi:hypothetical protein
VIQSKVSGTLLNADEDRLPLLAKTWNPFLAGSIAWHGILDANARLAGTRPANIDGTVVSTTIVVKSVPIVACFDTSNNAIHTYSAAFRRLTTAGPTSLDTT